MTRRGAHIAGYQPKACGRDSDAPPSISGGGTKPRAKARRLASSDQPLVLVTLKLPFSDADLALNYAKQQHLSIKAALAELISMGLEVARDEIISGVGA